MAFKQYGKSGASAKGPKPGFSTEAGPGYKAKKAIGNAQRVLKSAVGKVASTKGGKAGMALAGLAAAGGLGMAGMKAIGARKKKANSLQGRLSSAMKRMGR